MTTAGEILFADTKVFLLVQTHRLTGKRVHDCNIVATMLVEGIDRLTTENAGDFASFEEIEAIGLEAASP